MTDNEMLAKVVNVLDSLRKLATILKTSPQ